MLIEVLSIIWSVLFVAMLIYMGLALYTIYKLKKFNKISEDRILKWVEVNLSEISEEEAKRQVDELSLQSRKERYEYVKFQEKWYSELFDFGKYRYEAWVVLRNGSSFTLNTRFRGISRLAHKILNVTIFKTSLAKEIGWRDVNANDKIKYIKGVA